MLTRWCGFTVKREKNVSNNINGNLLFPEERSSSVLYPLGSLMGMQPNTPFGDGFWGFGDPKILFMAFTFSSPSSKKPSKSQHKKINPFSGEAKQ